MRKLPAYYVSLSGTLYKSNPLLPGLPKRSISGKYINLIGSFLYTPGVTQNNLNSISLSLATQSRETKAAKVKKLPAARRERRRSFTSAILALCTNQIPSCLACPKDPFPAEIVILIGSPDLLFLYTQKNLNSIS